MRLEQRIGIIEEQFDDILSHSGDHADFNLKYECKKTKTKKTSIKVTFSATINSLPYNKKVFVYNMDTQTEDGFVNEIKAYLLDVLDTVSNL